MAEARGNINLRWVGDEALDLVALTRMRSFSHAVRDLPRQVEALHADGRLQSGDCLIAEVDGHAIATTTSLTLTMWVRGTPLPCQGVAYVGTIKTHRRRGGVASTLMRETLNKARERRQVLSALMPFRASFYEHFGYGLVERRNEWTIPVSILPTGDFDGFRLYEPTDFDAISACKQRITQVGQCDIERPSAAWAAQLKKAEEGFTVVDRPDPQGPIRSWMSFVHASEGGHELVRVTDNGVEDDAALIRQLHFLASLKDQFYAAVLNLPTDYPLNWLLNERQFIRGTVIRPAAFVRPHTRMQMRVLDHERLIGALHPDASATGALSVRVLETENTVSTFQIEYASGRAAATAIPSGRTADLECDAPTWAAVILGDLLPVRAHQLGLLTASNPAAIQSLDPLTVGPTPFTTESF